ncbi:hypothetical protein ASPWEDRAFT_747697 [Aspergillus wentii DTO 134E9]|uniref:Major facilitator superfamily (MFS) profile domain-containing protein n=1 Tax=Aspergillus wentii DTO 134E9 TaxID=1073089 RepID=A0A1L9R9U3_ASPWE|nr:uncharacterized protein ASPWEDRAFT_747697 [Aspergillus wentii DTO 134E9]OJJ31669.1 hypothetical protein ASPWEDRAFT_747697 [Aspergillus wentii DTO 134E9]
MGPSITHDAVESDTNDDDAVLVQFDGPDDPDNPHNWPWFRRIWVTFVLALFNLIGTISSSIFGTGKHEIMDEFHVSSEVAVLGTSLFLIGYIFGFLIFGPLSERFGRKYPLILGTTISSLFDLMPALGTNIETVLVGRFFAGLFGVSPVAVLGGIVSDCFTLTHRGTAMAFAVALVFSGPTFGPVIGGFITGSSLGWRWTMWVIIIAGLTLSAVATVVFPETYPAIILKKRARRLRKKYGNPNIKSQSELQVLTAQDVARLYLARPFWLFVTQPILALLTLYQSFIYGVLFLFYSSYPIAFGEVRGWHTGLNTLPLLGIIIGVFTGTMGMAIYDQLYFRYHCHAPDGLYIPESRLPPMILGAVLIPIGSFWYAWTASPNVPWPSSVCASIMIGCGMYLLFIQGFNYIVDCYTSMANSAMGVNGSMRSVFGAVFPLFATQMFHGVGVAWAMTIIGIVSACLIPVPIVFWCWGHRIRMWSTAKV